MTIRITVTASLLLCAALARADHAPIAEVALDPDEEQADKKTAWLADKAARAGNSPAAPVAANAVRPLSLVNRWTDEILPVPPDADDRTLAPAFDRFVRCHYTQVNTTMANGLLPLLRRAAARFGSSIVEIVSGYRAPKYQLMLRKKGHEVARDSAHPKGQAIDFRLPQVPTKLLLAFVRKQRLGGVGFYPESRFVHADVGAIRFWKGH